MKKCLTLLIASVLCLASFASPSSFKSVMAPWDQSLAVVKIKTVKPVGSVKVFDDPYVTNAGAYVIGTFNSPNYACNIQVTFNQAVGVPYYAVVSVLGLWDGSGSASEREFTILFSSWQYYKSVNFPMHSYEEAYTENAYCSDYGPQ